MLMDQGNVGDFAGKSLNEIDIDIGGGKLDFFLVFLF